MTLTASAPAALPTWNTGGANRTTPTAPKQALGWTNGEAPSSAFFNWWMNLTFQWASYLGTSVSDLESSKINKTGATDLSGTFTPTTTNTGIIGTLAKSFKSIDVNQISVNSDGVLSNLNPFLNGTGTLGSASKRWLAANVLTVNATTVNVDVLNVSGNIVADVMTPIGAGNGTLGSNGTPYGVAVARVIRSNNLTVYRKDQPLSYADLAMLNARCTVLALCKQTSMTSPAVLEPGEKYNVASITTAGGNQPYTVLFDLPVPPNAFVFVQPYGAAQSLAARAELDASGVFCTVTIYTSANAVVSSRFNVMVLGAPSATGAAGITTALS